MSAQSGIPSLWPSSIKLDVLSPTAILQKQATSLREMTRGLVVAEIATGSRNNGEFVTTFHISAPAIGYKLKLLTLTSPRVELPYPVLIESPQFPGASCATQDAFLDALQRLLSGPYATSVVQAMIAKSNETPGTDASAKS